MVLLQKIALDIAGKIKQRGFTEAATVAPKLCCGIFGNYILNKEAFMANTPEGQAGVILTPEAFREFERFFLNWLDRYQEEIEAGGLGNPKDLAISCALWAKAYLHTEKHRDKPAGGVGELGSEPQDHQEERDIDRLARIRSESDRRSRLFSASRISPWL